MTSLLWYARPTHDSIITLHWLAHSPSVSFRRPAFARPSSHQNYFSRICLWWRKSCDSILRMYTAAALRKLWWRHAQCHDVTRFRQTDTQDRIFRCSSSEWNIGPYRHTRRLAGFCAFDNLHTRSKAIFDRWNTTLVSATIQKSYRSCSR